MSAASEKPRLRPVDIEPASESAAREIREDTVAVLRGWLARAEAGEVADLVIVGTEVSDGSVSYSLTGSMDAQRRIGAVEMLKIELIDQLRDAQDDE